MRVSELIGFDINKTVHAYLIVSSGTVAAHEYSIALAKAFMCTAGSGGNEPCLECEACRKINAGTHPDVYILGNNKVSVDDIRDMRMQAYISSNESDKKIFIIENADKLNIQSQNALLKLLEEPPKGVIFILSAPSKSSVLPTVLSRVCVLSSENHSFDYYAENARALLQGTKVSQEQEELVASYLQAYDDTDITSLCVKAILDAFTLAFDYYSGKQTNVILSFPKKKETVGSAKNSEDELPIYLRVFMLVARNIAVYKKSQGKSSVKPHTQEFRKLCVKVSAKRAVAYYDIFENAYLLSENYANRNALYAYLSKKL